MWAIRRIEQNRGGSTEVSRLWYCIKLSVFVASGMPLGLPEYRHPRPSFRILF